MNIKFIKCLTLSFLFFIFFIPADLWASDTNVQSDFVHRINLFVFQVSLIIIAAWIGGMVFKKLHLPSVLGEIISGLIIGPFGLGSIRFLGFEEGIFPVHPQLPISIELYDLATIASIILLFFAGLQTDIRTFVKYSKAGSIIGIFGVIFSFVAGDFVGILLGNHLLGHQVSFFDPIPLFLGVISTATSVGISARILSEKQKINTPEGVTVLSAAVIDDVLGIIILAIIIGMAKKGEFSLLHVAMISFKALIMWLGFTILGFIYAQRISLFLKKLKDRRKIALMSFALALLLAGIFEHSGLAMIIGAYITGLSLSKTDLCYVIQDKLDGIYRFLVPIFFCVMGMLINFNQVFTEMVLKFSLLYTAFAVLGKMAGCCIPALFLDFNWRGALRVGIGMVPRGEVALIIAGIGLASGFINEEIFGVTVIMTFITTLITPLLLDRLLASSKPGIKKKITAEQEACFITYDMPSEETAVLMQDKVIDAFEREGFYIHHADLPQDIYYMRKDCAFITYRYSPQMLSFDCSINDEPFIRTLFFEVIAEFENFISNLKSVTDKEQIRRQLLIGHEKELPQRGEISKVLSPLAVEIDLKGRNKKEIVKELINLLLRSQQLLPENYQRVLDDILCREEIMSTGLQDGIAFPHARTDAVRELKVAIGLKKDGLNFGALDGKPSKLFILVLTPKTNPQPYIEFMAKINQSLTKEKYREKLYSSKNNSELYRYIIGG